MKWIVKYGDTSWRCEEAGCTTRALIGQIPGRPSFLTRLVTLRQSHSKSLQIDQTTNSQSASLLSQLPQDKYSYRLWFPFRVAHCACQFPSKSISLRAQIITMTTQHNEWETDPFKDGLVSIGTHNLYLRARGPPRDHPTSLNPVVIVESGLGAGHAYWAAVHRMLSASTRVYCYDRSGLGRSGLSPRIRSAENMAAELFELLEAVNVKPPYVLLAHSYGGIICREFLHLMQLRYHAKEGLGHPVVGMVLADCNTESTHIENPIPAESLRAMMQGLDIMKVTGLAESHKFTESEMSEFYDSMSQPNNGAESGKEEENMLPSSHTLASKKQLNKAPLSPYPVTVIKGNNSEDLERIFKAAVAKGSGTNEDREKVLQCKNVFVASEERWQRAQLQLSNNNRYVFISDTGHNPHMTHPDVVADEVLKVVEQAKALLRSS